MSNLDLYAVLGVLPDAEDIVIKAAYRALAQRYHPDKWTGNADEAQRRMSELNLAYGVLSDKAKRAEYDRTKKRTDQTEFGAEKNDYQSEAFKTALEEVEERWRTATSIFPDLQASRDRLNQISSSLAFAFVTQLLESKAFSKRQEMATHIEQAFLERYFGTNKEVVDFARLLIFDGLKTAAKALNLLVDVMGSDVEPYLLISRIKIDFKREIAATKAVAEARRLSTEVLNYGYIDDSMELAKLLGYSANYSGGISTFFSAGPIEVKIPSGDCQRFKSAAEFISWVQKELCPRT